MQDFVGYLKKIPHGTTGNFSMIARLSDLDSIVHRFTLRVSLANCEKFSSLRRRKAHVCS